MRAMRISLVATVTLALVGGLSVGVVAQDEGDPFATRVTGRTVEALGMLEPCEGEGKGCDQSVGRIVEWSDARLPAMMWERIAESVYEAEGPGGPIDASVMRLAYRLEDAAGAWAGTGQGLVQMGLSDIDIVWDEHIVLVGEGAYDGLSAVFKREFVEGQWTFDGYIFEGSVSPFPEPYEPGIALE